MEAERFSHLPRIDFDELSSPGYRTSPHERAAIRLVTGPTGNAKVARLVEGDVSFMLIEPVKVFNVLGVTNRSLEDCLVFTDRFGRNSDGTYSHLYLASFDEVLSYRTSPRNPV